jgi:hypothetical protein
MSSSTAGCYLAASCVWHRRAPYRHLLVMKRKEMNYRLLAFVISSPTRVVPYCNGSNGKSATSFDDVCYKVPAVNYRSSTCWCRQSTSPLNDSGAAILKSRAHSYIYVCSVLDAEEDPFSRITWSSIKSSDGRMYGRQ